LGRVLLELPKDTLSTEIGPGYVNEERIDAPRNEFVSGRAYAKYVHTLSKTASFSQDCEYLHHFSDSDDYRLNTETAIIASLTEHLSLKASYVWHRVGLPPPNTGKDDTLTSVALIVNY
jgi:putative salt-induced outer membrane protein YdiY